MNSREHYLALAAVLAWVACGGVGRPLVDSVESEGQPTSMTPEITCPRPTCSPQPRALVITGAPVLSLPSSCTARAPQDVDLDQLIARGGCRCEQLRLSMPPTEQVLRDLTLHDCSLQIVATVPTSLRMEGPSIQGLSLDLVGPILLSLADSATLKRVAVRADGDAGESARLLIEQSQAQDLSVEQVQLSLVRSTLGACSLRLPKLTAESAELRDCTIEVDSFSAIDSRLERVSLAVQDGSMAASSAWQLLLEACETFLLAGSDVAESQLRGCQSLLRLYGTTLQSSLLDGPIESDGSWLSEVWLGLGEPSRLTAWESQITNSAFCGNTEELRLASGSIRCSVCEGALATSSANACQEPQGEMLLMSNVCPALDPLPLCSAPFPQRDRP